MRRHVCPSGKVHSVAIEYQREFGAETGNVFDKLCSQAIRGKDREAQMIVDMLVAEALLEFECDCAEVVV